MELIAAFGKLHVAVLRPGRESREKCPSSDECSCGSLHATDGAGTQSLSFEAFFSSLYLLKLFLR